jgi:hypothetical protein
MWNQTPSHYCGVSECLCSACNGNWTQVMKYQQGKQELQEKLFEQIQQEGAERGY